MPNISFSDGDRYGRKYLVTIARWGATDTSASSTAGVKTEVLGIRTEDSSIEFNLDSETTTDIRGNNYTDVNKTEPQQSFDPYFIRKDSDLGKYLSVHALRNDYEKYNKFDVYIVAMYLTATEGTGKTTIEYASSINDSATSATYYTVKHSGCSIIPTSIGGDTRINMPIEVHFSNKITEGTINRMDQSFTFTAIASANATIDLGSSDEDASSVESI